MLSMRRQSVQAVIPLLHAVIERTLNQGHFPVAQLERPAAIVQAGVAALNHGHLGGRNFFFVFHFVIGYTCRPCAGMEAWQGVEPCLRPSRLINYQPPQALRSCAA